MPIEGARIGYDQDVESDVPGGSAFDAWRVPLLSRDEFWALSDVELLCEEQLRYLVWFGTLAPSSHNTVPQRFRLRPRDRRIDVFVDPDSILPESDPTGRQCLVSVGCCLGNLETAARALGLRLDVDIRTLKAKTLAAEGEHRASGAPPIHVLSVVASRAATTGGTDLLELLRRHKVVRAEYDRRCILPVDLAPTLRELVASACLEDGQLALHLIEGSRELKILGRFQEQADRFVLENRRFARELGQWLLPNDERQAKVGMRGREFGFDDDFSGHVHVALLGQRRLLPDQLAGFARGGRIGVESSSAVGVITVAKDDPEHWVLAGRAAQRVSLELQRQGLSSAYHAALTEVKWAATIFAATVLRSRRTPAVIMRMGRPKRPSDTMRERAARPTVDEVLLS